MPIPPIVEVEQLAIQIWRPCDEFKYREHWHFPGQVATGCHILANDGVLRQMSIISPEMSLGRRIVHYWENGSERRPFIA